LTKEDDKEEAPSPIKNIYEKSDDQQQNMTIRKIGEEVSHKQQ
jgi:hypothetical protein